MSQVALEGFQRSLRAAYGVFEIEPMGTQVHAAGAMVPLSLGPFSGFEIDAQSVRSIRPALGDTWSSNAFILLPVTGDVVVRHYERVAPLSAGDVILMDSRSPCTIDVETATRSAVLAISRDMLSQLRPNDDHLYGKPIRGQLGMGRLLSTMLQSLQGQERTGDWSRDSAAILSVIQTMLDCALGARTCESDRRKMRAGAKIDAMRAWAEEHAEDPGMDADMLADKFCLSRRTLYRLFADIGTTPHRWLSNIKLDLARRWLTDADSPYHTISQVAFAAGFNDSSHFARLFRRRFGISPNGLRH